MINKIGVEVVKSTLQSVYDNQSMTAIELSAAACNKVDECVELVNGVEQSAINATAIVDQMRSTQEQYVTDNADTRATLIADNQTFLDELKTANDTLKADMTNEKNAYKIEIENDKTAFETTMNTNMTDFTTSLNTSKTTLETQVNTALNNANALDGQITSLINEANAKVTGMETEIETVTVPTIVNTKLTSMVNDGSLVESINNQLIKPLQNDIAKLKPETMSRIIYVSINTGSDSNDGSITTPFKTIAKALSVINKNILDSDIRIRILPGDYMTESSVYISLFKGSTLTLVAYDGANEITTVNDLLTIPPVYVHNCDWVELIGLRTRNNNASGYGIFVKNTLYCGITGIKNTQSTATTGGIGVTRHSSVGVENCLMSGVSSNISCSYNSKCYSKDWVSGSSAIDTTLSTHHGGVIHVSGSQPSGNISYDTGGIVFSSDFTGQPQVKYYQLITPRVLSTQGDFTIDINLPSAPTWCRASLIIPDTMLKSNGQWNAGSNYQLTGQSCFTTNSLGVNSAVYNYLLYLSDNGNTTNFAITSVTNHAINITQVGSAIVGTAYIMLECGF